MTNTNDWNGLLLDIVTSTKEGVSKGIDFAMEQAPDVVHQLLLWKFWESIIMLVLCVAPCFLVIYVSLKDWPRAWKQWTYDEIELLLNISGLLVGFGLFLAVCHYATTALEIKLAPKLYLIEYVSSLAKR